MSQTKAKKKKRITDTHDRKFSYDECQTIAAEMAKDLYRKRAARDIDQAIDFCLMLNSIILNDLYGFGGGRLLRVREEWNTRLADYAEKKFTREDVLEIHDGLWQKEKAFAKRKGLDISHLED